MGFIENLSLNLSVNKNIEIKDLEITAVRICPVRCKYCPQDVLINASKEGLNKKVINFELFKSYLENIPKNTTIHWTGYSESLANKGFPEMVEYAKELGYEQSISTTLSGHKRCLDYLYYSNAFNYITLHMPDQNGLMTDGALKVNTDYINALKSFLKNHKKIRGNLPVNVVCYGDYIHSEIYKVINEYKSKANIVLKETQNIHTRGGLVSNIPGLLKNAPGLKKTQSIFRKIIEYLLSIANTKINVYRCSYYRLNQPVLLGDGSMYLCCMDYGLKCSIGNIKEKNINKIFKKWYSENKKSFSKGDLEPCKSCEYYKKVRIKDILIFIYKKLRNILKKLIIKF